MVVFQLKGRVRSSFHGWEGKKSCGRTNYTKITMRATNSRSPNIEPQHLNPRQGPKRDLGAHTTGESIDERDVDTAPKYSQERGAHALRLLLFCDRPGSIEITILIACMRSTGHFKIAEWIIRI